MVPAARSNDAELSWSTVDWASSILTVISRCFAWRAWQAGASSVAHTRVAPAAESSCWSLEPEPDPESPSMRSRTQNAPVIITPRRAGPGGASRCRSRDVVRLVGRLVVRLVAEVGAGQHRELEVGRVGVVDEPAGLALDGPFEQVADSRPLPNPLPRGCASSGHGAHVARRSASQR